MVGKHLDVDDAELRQRVPEEYKRFVVDFLERHGIDAVDLFSEGSDFNDDRDSSIMRESGVRRMLDVAFKYPIKMLSTRSAFHRSLSHRHAVKHAQAGVDVLVAAGGESAGHCGEIATIVLIPEAIDAVRDYPEIEVRAAGGIATGRRMAACMARARPTFGAARSG